MHKYNAGIARGCGWQKIGAFVNLGSYYIVGIPSAVFLAFLLHIGGRVNSVVNSELNYTNQIPLLVQKFLDLL